MWGQNFGSLASSIFLERNPTTRHLADHTRTLKVEVDLNIFESNGAQSGTWWNLVLQSGFLQPHFQPVTQMQPQVFGAFTVADGEYRRLFLDLRLPEMLLYARKKPAPSVMATINHFNHTVTALQGSILRLHSDTMPSIRLRPSDSNRCDSRERGAVSAVAAWSKSRLSRHDLLVPDQQPCTVPEMTYKRARMIAFWIDVASELQRLNNLYSMQAVLTGLQTNAIHRLRQCWTVMGQLYPQHLRRFESMVALMSHENNYERLRTVISKHLQSLQKIERARRKQRQNAKLSPHYQDCDPSLKSAPPTENLSVPGLIPYLGLYTHDLTYLNYASPDTKPLQSTTNDSVPHSASQPDIRLSDQPETSLIGSLANALDITSPGSDTNTSPIEKSISVNDVSDENNARRRVKIRIEREIHFPSGVIRIGPFYKPTLNDDENNNNLSKTQPEVLINFEKHYREGEFLKDLYLLQYTSRSYDLKVDEKYKCWLDSFPSLSEDEARQLSLDIEPAQDSATCMTSSSLAVPKMAAKNASCSKLTAISYSSPVTRPKSHSVTNYSSSRPSILSHPYFNQETADNVLRASTTDTEPIRRKTPLSLRQKLTKSARYSGRQFFLECERKATNPGSPVTDRRRSCSKSHRHSSLTPREFRSRSLSQPRIRKIRIRVTLDDPLYVNPITARISKSWQSVGLGSTPNLHQSFGEDIPFEHSVIEKVSLADSVSDVLFRVLTKFRVPDFRVSEFDLVELHPKNLNRILPTTANAYHELCSSLEDSAVKSTSAEDADILLECACVRRLRKVSMITSIRTRHSPFTVIAGSRPNKRISQQSDRIRGSVVALFPPDP
ncbi:Ral guanine nucleotide dissociation stimulator-like 2 [Clonorchis sinensis]|uniref:Ral guanine nucleotide dissociation stimulator-like 2 n=1 Tax=Clonorchis sinensis TaxID=79923 RepID=G7Y632_CLOSI|nr:Ral guanine nucleotide dissociation stimulator-like 2 [Clonorchis sinensis]